jgi:hypothetical protein
MLLLELGCLHLSEVVSVIVHQETMSENLHQMRVTIDHENLVQGWGWQIVFLEWCGRLKLGPSLRKHHDRPQRIHL